jgi:hypothetical protein
VHCGLGAHFYITSRVKSLCDIFVTNKSGKSKYNNYLED